MAEVSPTPSSIPPAPKHRAILDLPELYARGPSYGAVFGLGLLLLVMIGGVLSVAVWLHSATTTQLASVDARLGQQLAVVDTKANQSAVELAALRAELKAHREQTAQRFDALEQRMDRGFAELKELIQQRRQ